MAENKNNRKSNRNFRLDKHVERHFEIEKGTDDASVMPDNTLTEPPSTPPEVGPAPISPEPPTGDDEESESGGSSIKWVTIVLIIVAAIAIFAYIFMSGGKDKENTDKEIPQTEQNDSNQNSKNVSDSVTNYTRRGYAYFWCRINNYVQRWQECLQPFRQRNQNSIKKGCYIFCRVANRDGSKLSSNITFHIQHYHIR